MTNRRINLGSSNHPDNFVTEKEFADIVAEAKADAEETKAREEEEALCAAGRCDHYTCTEGRSVDEWDEPEPTDWDYNSEIDRGGDSDEDLLQYEADCDNEAADKAEAAAKKGEAK
jgi:hypothetical protein